MSYISAAQAKQIAQRLVDNLKDGTLVPKLAENLTPYAEDSGTTQTQPFFLEGTATGNGESRVDAKQVPAYAFLQEKRGNMVCVNQLFPVQSTQTVNGITFTSNGDGSYTLNGTATATAGFSLISESAMNGFHVGRTMLMLPKTGDQNLYLQAYDGSNEFSNGGTFVMPNVTSQSGFFRIRVASGTVCNNVKIHPILVDLTQWFGSTDNIPAYLLSHPEAFGRYYKGSLAYEPGRLEPATGRYLTSVGRNIWDEEWENGSYNIATGEAATGSGIRTKNYIPVIPLDVLRMFIGGNDTYCNVCFYDSSKNFVSSAPNNTVHNGVNFTVPSDAYFMRISWQSGYGTTYNHDITISLYYSGESGYDKYYPHEILATIDTGSEDLGAFDYKVPSGLITRVTGSYTFTGNETVIDNGTYAAFSGLTALINGKPLATNIICSVGLVALTSGVANTPMSISFGSAVNINIDNVGANVLNYMVGKTIYFELATPTTEQGTPFQETVPIDDFGQLSWSDTDVPQGNQIFYPVDYKAYEDTLIKYTDGDATSIALKNAITDAALNARGYYKMEDLSSSCISANDSNLTFSITKAVKMNGLVNLTLRASNGTGASISAGTVLFTLSNNTHRSEQIKVIGVIDTASQVFNISSIGQVTCNGAIADGSTLHLYVSFTVT